MKLNRNMSLFLGLVGLLIIAMVSIVMMRSARTSKIGVVDMQQVAQAPRIRDQHEQNVEILKLKPRQEELFKLQKSYISAVDDLKKNEIIWDTNTRKKREAEIIQLEKKIRAKQEELNNDFAQANAKLVELLDRVFSTVAHKNKVGILLQKAVVLQMNEKLDLTQEVLTMIQGSQ